MPLKENLGRSFVRLHGEVDALAARDGHGRQQVVPCFESKQASTLVPLALLPKGLLYC